MLSLQEEFDQKYISSTEVCSTLGIARATLFHGLRKGKLPPPIIIMRSGGTPHTQLWIRDQVVEPLARWKASIDKWKGNA